MALPQEKASYTFSDYLAWDNDERIEIIDGKILMMAPPARIHQEVSGELFYQIRKSLEGKNCKVYAAPFAVRLFERKNDAPENVQTVFEPDISVICDKSKLDEHGCKGAPDMIIEILSPSTMSHDWLYKMRRYEQAGVQEYWIVSPKEQSLQVFLLKENTYRIDGSYGPDDIVKVNVLDGCFIELAKVFSE